jgi:carboxyl-terminal processing protease
MFISKGVIVSTKGRNRPENVITATEEGTLPYFPMVVLVNEHSASASEIVAGSLADNQRALVLGERTYGKGSVQELINLDGNQGELKLTVAYYYLPSGRLVHRKKDATDWGVDPKIVVPMTEDQEKKVMIELDQHERFLPPVPKPGTTRPSTGTTTQAVSADVQLQRAVDTIVGLVVLQNAKTTGGVAPPPNATSQPATKLPPTPDSIDTSAPAPVQVPKPASPTTKPAGGATRPAPAKLNK